LQFFWISGHPKTEHHRRPSKFLSGSMTLKNWIFLEEYSEAGICYMLAKKNNDGPLYRWEPLASRIHGYEAAVYRQNAEKRCKILAASEPMGILPLEKPINHQDKLWIGWEARQGISPFSPNYQAPDLPRLIRDLYPLISSFEQFHYRGALVGRPDWHRLYHNDSGFYIVDPWCRPYLISPDTPLPPGLEACRTPESYFGDPHSQASDIFYLGLLIYVLLTNHLPFALEDGWPTTAILKGEIIPITHYRPELNPGINRLLNRMLSLKKYERPTALQVKLFWKDMIMRENYFATDAEKVIHLKKYRQELKNRSIRKYSIRVGLILLITTIAFISGRYMWQSFNREPQITQELIETFYHNHTSMLASSVTSGDSLFQDVIEARNQRLQLITELLGRPVIEVKNLAIKKRSPKQAVVEVHVLWWHWSGGLWRKELRQEFLYLKRNGRHWQIEKRYQHPH